MRVDRDLRQLGCREGGGTGALMLLYSASSHVAARETAYDQGLICWEEASPGNSICKDHKARESLTR